MHFLRITADATPESGVADALAVLETSLAATSPFDQRDYGPGIKGVAVVLVCQPGEVKRRVRLARSDQRLFLDVVLELDRAVALPLPERVRWLADRLAAEVPDTVDSFELPAFDGERFRAELAAWCATVTS
jgi:hypothetical protein